MCSRSVAPRIGFTTFCYNSSCIPILPGLTLNFSNIVARPPLSTVLGHRVVNQGVPGDLLHELPGAYDQG